MERNLIKFVFSVIFSCAVLSCADNEEFTAAEGDRVSFSADTICFDTVFANVPSATKSFWIYNRAGHGLRFNSVMLSKGAKSEFRVNIDGEYLGKENNYATSDIEVRKNDSLRVFIELTGAYNGLDGPQPVDEDLLVDLGNNSLQKVHLCAYSWNADMLRNLEITQDTTLGGSGRPLVVYGDIKVDSLATLSVKKGTTLYFHSNAGMDVYGRLLLNGTADSNVVLRGDRLDRMFDYLPYDRVPGQWNGVRLHESSYGNEMSHADIHSSFDGIVVDSSDVNRSKLTAEGLTVHNCQGYGIYSKYSKITLKNAQISNTKEDCIFVDGGELSADNCTMAQFYPFSMSGYALRMDNLSKPEQCAIRNSIITGYDDNVVLVTNKEDSVQTVGYLFDHCILRTPKKNTRDSICFKSSLFEDVKDTTSMGEKHFVLVDLDKQEFDFHLTKSSAAIGYADKTTSLPFDHDGYKRDGKPDAGAYEYRKEETQGNVTSNN